MRNDKTNQLKEMLREVNEGNAEYVITVNGKPSAVIIGYEEYAGLIETVNILSDADTTQAIEEAEADIHAGRVIDLGDWLSS